MRVYYGPTISPASIPCTIRLAQTTSTLVRCSTSGTDFIPGPNIFVVEMNDGRRVIGTDVLQVPSNVPDIISVMGCADTIHLSSSPNDTSSSVANYTTTSACPTSGGVTITIVGLHFNDPVTISVNGVSCGTVTIITTELMTCELPAGTGFDVLVTLSSGSNSMALVVATVIFDCLHHVVC
jgi:hypothetical protein